MGAKSRTVAVADLMWVGSLPTYHKAMCASFLACGCRVVSASPEPLQVRAELEELCGDRMADLGVVGIDCSPERGGLAWVRRLGQRVWRSALRRSVPGLANRAAAMSAWRQVTRIAGLDGEPIDLLFLPYLDAPFLSAAVSRTRMDALVRRPWAGLYLFPHWLRGDDNASRECTLRVLGSSFCRSIAVLDEGVRDGLAESLHGKSVFVMPDFTDERVPTETGLLEKRILDAARGRATVGLLGEISARKGIDDFLTLAEAAARAGLEWHFVVAGTLSRMSAGRDVWRLEHRLTQAPSNVSFFAGRIADGPEFNAAVRSLSVLWAAYPDFRHSSNMLTKAALMERPVIVRAGHLLADRVRRFSLGEVAATGDADEMLAILRRIQSEVPKRQYSRYRDEHSRARLVALSARIVEDARLV